ncbi:MULTISPECIES: glutamine amidotransferase [unclassified Bacteroides]|uniref:glutamine amidotransferase n=1 Tax=unclassified Bacteroides TaxID=2646097 RepID=UPI0003395BFA|nr:MULTISPECIES: glutamine amidotransferase [unclassified Bacteroides]CDB11061.1 class II glutamine amidotransferase [Bacteroides sp. CAG:633]
MEQLKHECGVAMIRLLKPLDYYQKKYGTWMYGLNKLYLLMEKQHNRGQEGAGLACVKLAANPGEEYMFRERALGSGAITEIFSTVQSHFKDLTPEQLADAGYAEKCLPFAGEVYMGHLRYSTTGKSGLTYVHPFLRRNNWRAKNLALCGNFNLTNVDEIFARITAMGQHPRKYADTYIMLEQVGHRLDREVERLFNMAEAEGLTGMDITHYIEEHIDLANVLRTSSKDWDGGYVMCGLTGSGESFAVRDPWGIRTAFWYQDEEIAVLASERPVIQTVLNVPADSIHELQPGQAIFISKAGRLRAVQINKQRGLKPCSFERIYFSRGSDMDIYRERKLLGEKLVPSILKAVNYDIDHTVFSFIPNTAEVAFYGMLQGLDEYLNEEKVKQIAALGHNPSHDELERILSRRIRSEKVAIKDIKLRTFIAEGNTRNDLAAHVYDITYGSLEAGVDNLVIIDDSIVRGTTLRQSIIGILDRLNPKKIVIVSSSPQVRYPDYYGIDMSRMSEFIAFRAAIELLRDRDMKDVIAAVYRKSKDQADLPKEQMVNYVKNIYAPFTDDEISAKMVELLKPENVRAKVQIVYQPLEGLHEACPNHPGDWYFSGDYPTPGGVKLLNKAFIDYIEQVYQF